MAAMMGEASCACRTRQAVLHIMQVQAAKHAGTAGVKHAASSVTEQPAMQ